jgi:hypothetical protein
MALCTTVRQCRKSSLEASKLKSNSQLPGSEAVQEFRGPKKKLAREARCSRSIKLNHPSQVNYLGSIPYSIDLELNFSLS